MASLSATNSLDALSGTSSQNVTMSYTALSQSIARYSSIPPGDEIRNIFVVLATLGANLIPLGVINFHDLPPAQAAVSQAFSAESPGLAKRYGELEDSLQAVVTCAMVFCSECHPMPIHYGFGAGVLQDWEWAKACFTSEVCAALDRTIAALKGPRKSFWLLKKTPHGMDHFKPNPEKIRKKARNQHEKARENLAKRIDKRGFPPAKDKSFSVNSWWIPFATWDSPYCLLNSGHSWDDVVRWQMDPGRLLYAFIVQNEVNIRNGELMLVPAGPGECLVRWLEGLEGVPFKLVAESEFDLKKLNLSTSTKNTLLFLDERRDAYVIRDPGAGDSRRTAGGVLAESITFRLNSPPQSPDVRELATSSDHPVELDGGFVPQTTGGSSTALHQENTEPLETPVEEMTTLSIKPPPAYSKEPPDSKLTDSISKSWSMLKHKSTEAFKSKEFK
jgi:hypothetical protein